MKSNKSRKQKTPLQQHVLMSAVTGLLLFISFFVYLVGPIDGTVPRQISFLIVGIASILKGVSNDEYYTSTARRFISETEGHTFIRHFWWLLKEVVYRNNGKICYAVAVFIESVFFSILGSFLILIYVELVLGIALSANGFWCLWILTSSVTFVNIGKWRIIRILRDYDEAQQFLLEEEEYEEE